MKQKSCHRLIFKLHSKQLKAAKLDFHMGIVEAMLEYPECVVALSESQALRFIDEIRGVADRNEQARIIKNRIKREKRKERTAQTGKDIAELYKELYQIQYVSDYVCIIMDSEKDYDLLNKKGFCINGKKFRRFLGTNGGIKNSTIVYISQEIYPEMKSRLDNGRDMSKEFVPAKLEAYQALVCSGSTQIPQPNGIIVVQDCITHFCEDVITIDDSKTEEPELLYVDGYVVERNNSDGFGLMLPSYSRAVNGYLGGNPEETLSGMNSRNAWTKGMIYTFDFVDFAEKVAGTFEITDAWGDKRDVREAEVILTVSMLKLWDSYSSWEEYQANCVKNHYELSTPKTTPDRLENVRTTNYQFLQSYELTDAELRQLCLPTITELKNVLGMDYRTSLVFMGGLGLDEYAIHDDSVSVYIRALMANPQAINDMFIRRKIWNMICKKVEAAKRGCINVNANYAMILGDPYALAQSMFGLKVTGLLKAGECYHKYWIDKGASEIVCFRAPMTNFNNIRKLRLCSNYDTDYWFRYIKTASILNAWDTTCDAMNGSDFDGDTNMCTDNPILLKNTKPTRAIMCLQKKAEKKVPTEEDIITANKLAFNDDIGTVTNRVTSMIERQAGFPKDSDEYKALEYRIMCGQSYQQATIDRAKGIVAKSMPEAWYSFRDCVVHDDDDEKTAELKEFNQRIVAENKPYFMIYVYPQLRKKYRDYVKSGDEGVRRRYGHMGYNSMDALRDIPEKTQEIKTCIDFYDRFIPTGNNNCVVNRISWLFEQEFDGYLRRSAEEAEFDYSILKSGKNYTRQTYNKVLALSKDYRKKVEQYFKRASEEKLSEFDSQEEKQIVTLAFIAECEKVCSNEDELCDIVVDMCYRDGQSKQFAWDICGEVMVRNLARHSGIITYPERTTDENFDFDYCGDKFILRTVPFNDYTE